MDIDLARLTSCTCPSLDYVHGRGRNDDGPAATLPLIPDPYIHIYMYKVTHRVIRVMQNI